MRSYRTDTHGAPGSNRTATKGEFSTALSSAKREISPVPPWQIRLLTGPYLHLVLLQLVCKMVQGSLPVCLFFEKIISPSKVPGLRRWSWKCLADHWQAFPPKVFTGNKKNEIGCDTALLFDINARCACPNMRRDLRGFRTNSWVAVVLAQWSYLEKSWEWPYPCNTPKRQVIAG